MKIPKIILSTALVGLTGIAIFGQRGEKQLKEKILKWIEEYYTECDKKYNINRSNKKKVDKEELLKHIKDVRDISCNIFDTLGLDNIEKRKRLIIAACFHDIEKIKNPEEHATLGAEYIEKNKEKFKKEFQLKEKEIEKIKEIIELHSEGKYDKGTGEINKENEGRRKLVKIIQDADKISKLYKDRGKDTKKEYDKKWSEYTTKQQKKIIMKVTKKGLNFLESEKIFGEIFDKI